MYDINLHAPLINVTGSTTAHISYANLLLVAFIALLLVLAYTILKLYNYMHLKRIDKNEYVQQSQAIRLERQRISSELHDELGSGLSSIKLYSELASKKRQDIHEFTELNEMIKEISGKINDIIWTTSTENDELDSVIFYIHEQLEKLFRYSDIKFESILPETIPQLKIKSESRRDFYLLAKEIAHNALKHSKADAIILEIIIFKNNITLSIKDNGKGFDPVEKKFVGMGLSNINMRVERLKGNLTIENYKGTKINVNIPITDNFYLNVEQESTAVMKPWWNFR